MATDAKAQHHILPLRLYFTVAGALMVLTALTVYVAQFHFGPYNLVVAMLVAATKASLVALFFMHLKYDNKVYLVSFITAIVLLAVFIVLTMFDTMTRGDVDPEKSEQLYPAIIYRQEAAPDSSAADSIGGMVADSLAPAADSAASDTTVATPAEH